jgi:hypothetical protein
VLYVNLRAWNAPVKIDISISSSGIWVSDTQSSDVLLGGRLLITTVTFPLAHISYIVYLPYF